MAAAGIRALGRIGREHRPRPLPGAEVPVLRSQPAPRSGLSPPHSLPPSETMSIELEPPTPTRPASPALPRRPARGWSVVRRAAYLLGALVALAGLALVGARWYAGRAEPDYARGAVLPGLAAPVEVWRDSLGVPHVWASSEADLFRAMGY